MGEFSLTAWGLILVAALSGLLLLRWRPWHHAGEVFRRWRPRRRTTASIDVEPRKPLQTLMESGLYWGVRIHTPPDSVCCSAILMHENRAYPLEQAPALPVAGCDATRCLCTYRGLLERRGPTPRRRMPDRRHTLRFGSPRDRRSLPDRRKAGQAWAQPV